MTTLAIPIERWSPENYLRSTATEAVEFGENLKFYRTTIDRVHVTELAGVTKPVHTECTSHLASTRTRDAVMVRYDLRLCLRNTEDKVAAEIVTSVTTTFRATHSARISDEGMRTFRMSFGALEPTMKTAEVIQTALGMFNIRVDVSPDMVLADNRIAVLDIHGQPPMSADNASPLNPYARAGIPGAEAEKWEQAGFPAARAVQWAKLPTSPRVATEWVRLRHTPATVRKWIDAGFTSDAAIEWVRLRHTPATATNTVTKWIDAGFTSDAAIEWVRLEHTPATATKWIDAGFTSDAAIEWVYDDFDIEEAVPWHALGLNSQDTIVCLNNHVSLEQFQSLLNEGCAKDVAVSLIERQTSVDEILDWLFAIVGHELIEDFDIPLLIASGVKAEDLDALDEGMTAAELVSFLRRQDDLEFDGDDLDEMFDGDDEEDFVPDTGWGLGDWEQGYD